MIAVAFGPVVAVATSNHLPLEPEDNVLAAYVARPDPEYGWVERSKGRLGETEFQELILTSQTWRGTPWKHLVYVIRPSTIDPNSTHAMLVIGGGRWRPEYERAGYQVSLPRQAVLYTSVAEMLRTPVAVVLQVPFQPMFDGLTEDWLIAMTFEKYLETGDPEWPLLLPMVKSAVRAMDAVQEFVSEKWDYSIRTFTVGGASKRGWTTWLTGAVDPRATALAPIVIDVLNMAPQMRHAKATWGAPSARIEPYTERGLLDRLESPEGRRLLDIVDPYSYRGALTQPKFIINGTNDDYWPVDSANLYWSDLPGEKYLLYVPNNGHGLRDYARLTAALVALHEQQNLGKPLPTFDWSFEDDTNGVAITVRADPAPARLRVWSTGMPTPDLREAKWTAIPLSHVDGEASYRLPRTRARHQAFFVEAEFRAERPLPLFLSTTIGVVPPSDRGHATRAPAAPQ